MDKQHYMNLLLPGEGGELRGLRFGMTRDAVDKVLGGGVKYTDNIGMWRACKRAGLRRIGWHVCRHTFASHLVMRGAPIKAVQELMGHSTMEMTMRYSHLSPDVRRDAVGLLDKPAVRVHGTIAAQGGIEEA